MGGSWNTLPIPDGSSVAVASVPASVAGGCPPSLSGCRQGPRMAPHDDDGDDGAGIRGGSIVESVCCSCGDGDDGDGWTVGDVPPVFEMVTSEDGVFLTDIIRARGWIVEDAAHL